MCQMKTSECTKLRCSNVQNLNVTCAKLRFFVCWYKKNFCHMSRKLSLREYFFSSLSFQKFELSSLLKDASDDGWNVRRSSQVKMEKTSELLVGQHVFTWNFEPKWEKLHMTIRNFANQPDKVFSVFSNIYCLQNIVKIFKKLQKLRI